MRERDEQIQDALDREIAAARETAREPARAAADDDEAAYRVVFAALAEDEGFALPAGFAEAMAARLMPAPLRASPYERYVLPVFLVAAFAMGIPAVVAALRQALRSVAGATGGGSGLQLVAGIALVLLVLAAADRVARRAGWSPG